MTISFAPNTYGEAGTSLLPTTECWERGRAEEYYAEFYICLRLPEVLVLCYEDLQNDLAGPPTRGFDGTILHWRLAFESTWHSAASVGSLLISTQVT